MAIGLCFHGAPFLPPPSLYLNHVIIACFFKSFGGHGLPPPKGDLQWVR